MLYGRRFKHEMNSKGSSSRQYVDNTTVGLPEDDLENEEIPTPVDPAQRSSSPFVAKPYVPPSRVNSESSLPFGSVLDGPLG